MWISECENICSFLSHKKELLNFFYDNIKNENLILEKMKGYNTYLDEKSLLLGIKLSLKAIKRVQLYLTANRS